jgi:hypothetical protein
MSHQTPRLAIAAHEKPTECRICRCTDDAACAGGCSWAEDPERLGHLCSSCLLLVLLEMATPAALGVSADGS